MLDDDGEPYWVDKRIVDSKWKQIFDSAGQTSKEEEEQEQKNGLAHEFSTVDLDVSGDGTSGDGTSGDGVSGDGDGSSTLSGVSTVDQEEEMPLFRRASAWFASDDSVDGRRENSSGTSPFSPMFGATAEDDSKSEDDEDDDDGHQAERRDSNTTLLSFFGFGGAGKDEKDEDEEDVEGLAQKLVQEAVKNVLYALDPRQLEIDKLQKRIRQLESEQQGTKMANQLLLEQKAAAKATGAQAGGEAGGEAGDVLGDLAADEAAPLTRPAVGRGVRRTTLLGEMFGALGFGDAENLEEGGGEKDSVAYELLNQGAITQEEYEQLLAVELKAEGVRAALEMYQPPPVLEGKNAASGEGTSAAHSTTEGEQGAGGVSDILLEVKCSFPNTRTDHFLVGSTILALDHDLLSQLLTTAGSAADSAAGADRDGEDGCGDNSSGASGGGRWTPPGEGDKAGGAAKAKVAMTAVTISCPVDTGGTVTCRLQLVPAAPDADTSSTDIPSTDTSSSAQSAGEGAMQTAADGVAEVQPIEGGADDDAEQKAGVRMHGYGQPVLSPTTELAVVETSPSSSWWDSDGEGGGGLLGLDPSQEANRRMRDAYSSYYLAQLSMAQLVQRCALRNIDRSKCENREDLVKLVHTDLSQR
jgi:hypothetical protein